MAKTTRETKEVYQAWALVIAWVLYVVGFIVWLFVDPYGLFSQAVMIAFVVPAFVQPLFYYLLLGLFLMMLSTSEVDSNKPRRRILWDY